MFWEATAFNADISKWNVARVTTMSEMFSMAESFNENLAEWDVSSVTDMAKMFSEATEFNADSRAELDRHAHPPEHMYVDQNEFLNDKVRNGLLSAAKAGHLTPQGLKRML